MDIIIISLNVTCSRHDIVAKLYSFGINNNRSLSQCKETIYNMNNYSKFTHENYYTNGLCQRREIILFSPSLTYDIYWKNKYFRLFSETIWIKLGWNVTWIVLYKISFGIRSEFSYRKFSPPSWSTWVHPVFSGVRVTRSLVFCVLFCRSFSVLFLLAIVLSVLRLTDSDYPFGIFWQPSMIDIN